ncbi:stage II sporulation protein M [Paenibacillus sp. strain BS8-2]
MFKWQAIWGDLKSTGRFIGIAAVLFIAGIVVGASNPAFHSFLDSQLAALGQLVDTVEKAENKTLAMIVVIFLNNAIKSIMIIFLGAFFGVLPFIFLVVNGMVIGYLVERVSQAPDSISVFDLVVKGLLPHGIIEIPAIIVACAYGIRFGVLVLRLLGNLLFARNKVRGIGDEFTHFIIRIVPIIIILTIALLIASVIESTFTGWLLSL